MADGPGQETPTPALQIPNLVLRLLTALVLIPVILGLVRYGSSSLLFLVVAAVGVAGWLECWDLMDRMGVTPFRWTGAALTALLPLCLLASGQGLIWLPVALTTLLIAWMATAKNLRAGLDPIVYTLFGALYSGGLLGIFLLLHARPNGPGLIFFVLFVVWVGDSAGYAAGKWIGRRPLAPRISPGKSWEGAVANALGGVAGGSLAKIWFLPTLPWGHCLLAALICGIIGQFGDLFESLLKRCAEVKDSGNWVPGHGGLLDRIDSLLFAGPAFYCYLRLFL